MIDNTIKLKILDSIFCVPYLKDEFEDNLYLILEKQKLHLDNKIFMFANNKIIEHLFDNIIWDNENDDSWDFKIGGLVLKGISVTVVSSSKLEQVREMGEIIIDVVPNIESVFPKNRYSEHYKIKIRDINKTFSKIPNIISSNKEIPKTENIPTNNMVIEFYSNTIKNKIDKSHTKLPCGKIIMLCGFRKFKNDFLEVEKMLTLSGNTVLTPFQFELNEDEIKCKNIKEIISLNHITKIDMSDEIFVIDLDGYVDIETKKLINYALSKKKYIRYLTNHIG